MLARITYGITSIVAKQESTKMFARKRDKVEFTPEDPCFSVRYIGQVETTIPNGKGCTNAPVRRMLEVADEEKKMRKMFLIVNTKGVYTKDMEDKSAEYEKYDITSISYCCADRVNNPRIFSWIYKLPGTRKLECHGVLCSSKEKAQAISMLLSRTFHLAYRDWKANKERVARHKNNTENLTRKIANLSTSDDSETIQSPGQNVHTEHHNMNITEEDDDLSFSDNNTVMGDHFYGEIDMEEYTQGDRDLGEVAYRNHTVNHP